MRTRSVVIQRLHHSISDATRAWSLQQVPSSLWVYLLRYGIPHMLTLDQKVEARERLADLDFTGMYLYWLYRDNSEDFSPLLRIWRALGTEHAESLYKKTIENVRISHPDSLILLRNVVEFFRDAGWLKSAAQVAKSAVTEHQRLLGAKADQTLMSLNQYALAEKAIGNYQVAI
ncbi:MAG: hypothetical protein VX278_07360, partial [Myxococcota bacterium]|nr:hypothetical protein [Myxococcota bacterium]